MCAHQPAVACQNDGALGCTPSCEHSAQRAWLESCATSCAWTCPRARRAAAASSPWAAARARSARTSSTCSDSPRPTTPTCAPCWSTSTGRWRPPSTSTTSTECSLKAPTTNSSWWLGLIQARYIIQTIDDKFLLTNVDNIQYPTKRVYYCSIPTNKLTQTVLARSRISKWFPNMVGITPLCRTVSETTVVCTLHVTHARGLSVSRSVRKWTYSNPTKHIFWILNALMTFPDSLIIPLTNVSWILFQLDW